MMWTRVASVAVTALLLGPGGVGAANGPGVSYQVFVDLSGSVTPKQREGWQKEAERLLNALSQGDSIRVLPIHEHTSSGGALFQAQIPLRGTTRTMIMTQNAALVAARTGTRAALEQAFAGKRTSASTDVLSAIDRLQKSSRPVVLVFFSDMLNSTAELDMERPPRVTAEAIPAMVKRIVRTHSWGDGTLPGTTVYCVLNSIESGTRSPVNTRLTLRRFFQVLFENLGGTLVSFETELPEDFGSSDK